MVATAAIAIGGGLATPAANAQTTVTLSPQVACSIERHELNGDSTYCKSPLPVGEQCADACQWHRALVRFDVTGGLPANAVVQSATLSDANAGTLPDAHPLTTDWDATATWEGPFGSGSEWSALQTVGGGAEGDYDPTPIGDVTPLVQSWLRGANHGLLFKDPTRTNWNDVGYIAPRLTITYVIDTTPPVVALSGTLASEAGSIVVDDRYGLHVAGQDALSGVKKIRVAVDGVSKAVVADGVSQVTPNWPCDAGGCARQVDFDFVTADYDDGQRVVTVNVTDQANNTTTQTITVTNSQYGMCMLGSEGDDDYCSEGDREDFTSLPALPSEPLPPDEAIDYQDCLDAYPGQTRYCDQDPFDEDEISLFAAPGTRFGVADENLRSFAVTQVVNNEETLVYDGATPPHTVGRAGFESLKVKRIRRILPWNVMRMRDLGTSAYPPPQWMIDEGAVPGLKRRYDDFVKLYDWATDHNPPIEIMVSFQRRDDRQKDDAVYERDSQDRLVLVNKRPVLVQHGDASDAPSIDDYVRETRRFHNRFPRVRYLGPWNEPNNAKQPTRTGGRTRIGQGAEKAARYANALEARVCKISDDRCRIVAGEFIDAGGWKKYVNDYRAALSFTPTIWGFHPYGDVVFSERYRGVGAKPLSDTNSAWLSNAIPGNEQLWFTEVGARIDNDYNGNAAVDWAITPAEYDLKMPEANADTAFLLDQLLPNISSGVNRLYYYQLCEPNPDKAPDPANPQDKGLARHDSGLFARTVGCGARRAMGDTYSMKTNMTPYG